MKTKTYRLTIDVTYLVGPDDEKVILAHLGDLPMNLAGDGALTPEGIEGSVETYDGNVQPVFSSAPN